MAAEGFTNREIAQALFVSAKTVETHLSHAYAKLRIERRAELSAALAAAATKPRPMVRSRSDAASDAGASRSPA
jgi:hypothetical protein